MQYIYPDVVSPDRLVNEILQGLPNESHLSSKAKGPASQKLCSENYSTSPRFGKDIGSEEGDLSTATSTSGDIKEGGNDTLSNTVSNLAEQDCREVVILDCQSPSDYQQCHIRGAINVTFPAILIRRIAAGKIDLFERSKELKAKVSNDAKIVFVVYDSHSRGCSGQTVSTRTVSSMDATADFRLTAETTESSKSPYTDGPVIENTELSDLVSVVSKTLARNGCRVATLKGGLRAFKELYPEWTITPEAKNTCSNSDTVFGDENILDPGEVPLLGLKTLASLRIHDDLSDACDSSIGLDLDDAFPVEIIPNLYLGNAVISCNQEILERHNIKHVLNVTPNLPNVFEANNIRYLQIPISDHWAQSMIHYFPVAIQFIDEGRAKEEGVLVHCLAGISRSVTITMAYLMFKMSLSLNEAYDLVRSRKSNISPNFHFMGQLLDFERQLTTCQFLSPPALGSSPDSGIEFDRWNVH